MTHHPARVHLSPALGADIAAAIVAGGLAVAASGPARTASGVASLGLFAVALVRFGARPPVGFIVDEAQQRLVIGARHVALGDVTVGPRGADGRSFRLYELGPKVRVHDVRGDVVADAAALHATLTRLGAKVTVAHAERTELAVTVRRAMPITLALCGFLLLRQLSDGHGGLAVPILLFGGLAFGFALVDAVGVASPPLIVDVARKRVYWRRWHALADVAIEPPRISNLSAPDLVLRLSGRRLRLGLAWMPIAPIKAALSALPGVVPY